MEKKIVRYNLSMPMKLREQIDEICEEEAIDILTFIRKSIKIGLFIHNAVKSGGKICICNNKGEREYVEFV